MERTRQGAEWYIDRGALPREAADLLQALDPVLASDRMSVRRRGVRSDDADRPLHESPAQHPLLEAVFFWDCGASLPSDR
jgi:hypothetical protein